MAASREWWQWHLTPEGWVQGSERLDFGEPKIVPPPDDRVLTVEYREEMSSVYSKMEQSIRELWRSEDDAAVQKLVAEFGEHPPHTI